MKKNLLRDLKFLRLNSVAVHVCYRDAPICEVRSTIYRCSLTSYAMPRFIHAGGKLNYMHKIREVK